MRARSARSRSATTSACFTRRTPRTVEREALSERVRFFEKDALLLKKHPDRYRTLFLKEAHYLNTEGFHEHFRRGAAEVRRHNRRVLSSRGAPGMTDDFLERYLAAFGRIEGWFSPDACLMFMAYNQLVADEGLSGDVLESASTTDCPRSAAAAAGRGPYIGRRRSVR